MKTTYFGFAAVLAGTTLSVTALATLGYGWAQISRPASGCLSSGMQHWGTKLQNLTGAPQGAVCPLTGSAGGPTHFISIDFKPGTATCWYDWGDGAGGSWNMGPNYTNHVSSAKDSHVWDNNSGFTGPGLESHIECSVTAGGELYRYYQEGEYHFVAWATF